MEGYRPSFIPYPVYADDDFWYHGIQNGYEPLARCLWLVLQSGLPSLWFSRLHCPEGSLTNCLVISFSSILVILVSNCISYTRSILIWWTIYWMSCWIIIIWLYSWYCWWYLYSWQNFFIGNLWKNLLQRLFGERIRERGWNGQFWLVLFTQKISVLMRP